MKRIYRKISLEKYKSRFPGIINSYKDNTYYTFDVNNKYNNYNMFPSDIKFTEENYGKDLPPILSNTNGVVSYPTIKQWYYFFKDYYNRLKYISNCSTFYYKSLSDYATDNNIENIEEYQQIDKYYNDIGGEYMYNWLKKNCFTSNKLNELHIEDRTKYYDNIDFNAYININIIISNKINDIGLFTIFDDEWNSNTIYKSNKDTNYTYGTVTTYNNDDWVLSNCTENNGYFYSEKYNEFYFGNYEALSDIEKEYFNESNLDFENKEQWVRYSNLKNELIPVNKDISYSYKNNKIIINPDIFNMSDIYDIKTNDYGIFFIDNNLYLADYKDYVIYNNKDSKLNNKLLYVIKDNDNYYTIINNKRFYSYYDENTNNYYFKFTLSDEKSYINFNSKNKLEKKIFILFNDDLYEVKDKKIYINDYNDYRIYNSFDKYLLLNNNYYFLDNENYTVKYVGLVDNKNIIYKPTRYLSDLKNLYKVEEYSLDKDGYSVIDNNIYIFKSAPLYNFNEVNGITESKLDTLMFLQNAFDDVGNQLPSIFQMKNGKYLDPKENDFLDINIKVGYISDLTLEDDTENIFWGNMIGEVNIYDNENNGFKVTYKEPCENLVDKIKEFFGDYVDNLNCDITYYIGCIIKKVNNSYEFYEQNGTTFSGIKYIDKVKLIKKPFMYYFENDSYFNMYYYELKYDLITVIMTNYSNSQIKYKKSYFNVNMENNIFIRKDKDFNTLPVYRTKYNIGISTSQSIENNVDIERSKAQFISNHLKLIEAKTFNSLMTYGNGYFNIITINEN